MRSGLRGDQDDGVIVPNVMFNTAYASTINGAESPDVARAAEDVWPFVSSGLVATA